MTAPLPRGRGRRRRGLAVLVAGPLLSGPLVLSGLLGAFPPGPAGAATNPSPLTSAVSTTSGSWATFPMGNLSDPSNTFWQLVHAAPGSSHWSLVTPPGVADNGGLVAGASGGSLLVGVLPSGLLRYSPLALSSNGGSAWNPLLLPTNLAPLPDALAYLAGDAVAIVGGDRAVASSGNFSSWSPLVSRRLLSGVSGGCTVSALDAIALLPNGAPLVATGCRSGGRVGIFTRTAGTWRASGFALGGPLRHSATATVRLDVSGLSAGALVSANQDGRRYLVALRQTGAARWSAATPLALASGSSVIATSVGANGNFAVLVGTPGHTPSAFEVAAPGPWTQLPSPPSRTAALALPAGQSTVDATPVDAFTVDGGSLGVFALTPSGTTWVRVQSTQVPIAYGSSS